MMSQSEATCKKAAITVAGTLKAETPLSKDMAITQAAAELQLEMKGMFMSRPQLSKTKAETTGITNQDSLAINQDLKYKVQETNYSEGHLATTHQTEKEA